MSNFPVDDVTLDILLSACHPDAEDGQSYLANVLAFGDENWHHNDVIAALAEEVKRLRHAEAARPSPTDDDLSELRRHVEAMADDGLSFESAHAYQEARQALADAAPSLLAEVERLRDRPCPWVETSDEGTSHCRLAAGDDTLP